MIDYTYQAGGLAGKPEIRYTPNGSGVVNFTLAQSDAKKNEQGEWETTNQLWVHVSLWDGKTPWTTIIPDLPKGTKIVLHGKWMTRQWETKDGSKRSQTEFQARDAYIHGSHLAPQHTSDAQTAWNNAAQQGRTAMTGGFGNQDDAPPF